ncbi:type VII toxin-antitoxin system MntA family adenylyltransferase antitoxin [Caldivirga sp.]|uniref:type VII toxin-antitoxin system MntA family adenylyltransferase antitoxin n=1 Tax=Caldivirga sp. TaxID=2080243 RepID=UPI003D123525
MEIRSLLSRVSEELNDLVSITKISDVIQEYAVRWLLYAVHQDILDALTIIVAELGIRKPPSYSGLSDVLYERGLISNEVRELIRQIAINRNMLAHSYRSFSRDELLALRGWALNNMPGLLRQLIALVNANNLDPIALNELTSRVFAKYSILLAFLFGSRAKGTAREDSDYDIAVLAKSSFNYENVINLIKDLATVLSVPVDRVDLVDLSKAPNELIYVVLRDGVPIYAADQDLARKLIAHIYMRILDEVDLDYIYYRVFKDRILTH